MIHQTFVRWALIYSIQIYVISHQTFWPSHRKCPMCPMILMNIADTLVGYKVVDHSDVIGASPVGAAPATSSFST